MARIPMVTRTVKATKVNVLCINIDTAEPFNKTLIISGTYKDEKAMLKAATSVIENEMFERALTENENVEDTLDEIGRVKVVHIVESEEIETLYGMTEQKFIELAEVLPPRKVKAISTSKPHTYTLCHFGGQAVCRTVYATSIKNVKYNSRMSNCNRK